MNPYHSPFGSVLRANPWARFLIHFLLCIAAFILMFPMLWMISTSLKSATDSMKFPPALWPWNPQWKNYIDAVHYIPFFLYAFNTLVLCILGVVGMVCSSALVAYSFVRFDWPGKDIVFALMLGTMMVPFPVIMVPLYGVFKTLGWIGTLKPLWVPAFFANAFNIFLLRQFFLRVPKNITEAMALDGAGEFKIFWKIYVPVAAPALMVVALFHINFVWNDFLGPLLYLTDKSTFTLSLGLQQFQSQNGGTQWNLLMAASVLTVLPMLALFFVTQKYFLQGFSFLKDIDAH